MQTVAIIGAGPGGLVAARYLQSEGFLPTLFEQSSSLGGQWSGDPAYSAIWPSMRTNTSRIMTAFSDLSYPWSTPVFPCNTEVRAYLHEYATQFDLHSRIRLCATVLSTERDREESGWTVRWQDRDGASHEERFTKLILASGRFRKPRVPVVLGIETFCGPGGIVHARDYKQPDDHRGRRILVAGCSISSLEIAAELAMSGAARVISVNRRQRYIMHKILAGVPADNSAFTRIAALEEESLPMLAVSNSFKKFITSTSGSPEQFGAPKPAESILEAGVTQCQNFLPLVAEGLIAIKPWMSRVDGQLVRFPDGSSEEVDTIIFGTGYQVDLPYLDAGLRAALGLDSDDLNLYRWTFHPGMPDAAMIGMFEVLGPYFPVLELQARWIAYAWSGARPLPSKEEMSSGLAAARALPMHAAALLFARKAGVEPDLQRWPALTRSLLFGPLSAISFRLSGRDSLPEAPGRIAEEGTAFGAVPTPELTEAQRARIINLAGVRRDRSFARFADQLTASTELQPL